MSEHPPRSSLAGPLLLLVIVLADIGLVVWGWHLREQKKAADYGSSGLNFAAAPAPPAARPAPRRETPAPLLAPASGPLLSVVPEDAGPQAPKPATPKSDPLLKRAEETYYAVKNSPRFRNSKVIQEWKRDFLASPDLAAIEARYRKDRDARRFIRDMARSPHFKKMLGKYAPRPDLQAFLKEMAGKEAVSAAAGLFSEDGAVMGVFKNLRIPGVASPHGAPPPRRLNIKRTLDEEGVSSELQSSETGARR